MAAAFRHPAFATEVRALRADLMRGGAPVADMLRDRFVGVTALIVSAGPSAARWRRVYEALPGPVLVVCVKQAIELEGLGDLCSLHFCNSWNLRRYRYDPADTLRVYTTAPGDPRSFQNWDIRFCVKAQRGRLETSLAARLDFEDWTIDRTGLDRPWGPGIMYETVIYTLLQLGIRSIQTVGWDIADASGGNTHFYDSQPQPQPSPKAVSARHTMRTRLRRGLWWLSESRVNQFLRYMSGRKYNHVKTMPGEAEIVAASVPHLVTWLGGHGVTLTCHTDSPWLSAIAHRA
jgi:hypothetical protein